MPRMFLKEGKESLTKKEGENTMKRFGILAVILMALMVMGMVSGCTGGAREVDSCYECEENANWRASEYCVEGEYNQLYCANPCISSVDCDINYWCVPELDEGTTWANDGRYVRWVCMPEEYYEGKLEVWRSEYDCSPGLGDECPGDMTCLIDDTYYDEEYFCADECDYDDECLTDCCYDTGDGAYCAPYYPYCDY